MTKEFFHLLQTLGAFENCIECVTADFKDLKNEGHLNGVEPSELASIQNRIEHLNFWFERVVTELHEIY